MEEQISTEKKRYWLKLDKNFLKSSQMKVVKSMPNGKDYIIFYLSLMLESVETVGHLRFTALVPYNAEMLAAITDTNVDIVKSAIKIFCELGLMQIFDDGTIFLPQVPSITGKESESAERVRKYRERIKQQDSVLALHCNSDVTKSNDNKEKDKDKERIIIIKEIIEYLNLKLNSKYRYSTKSTKESINARLEEGFTLEDFKKVIDKQYDKWINTEWEQYLRPQTLFGTKFESYLNAPTKQGVKKNDEPKYGDGSIYANLEC
jgi:predicted phage replisome organizer/uncharacterized phage protein (TIGR02220 family)